MNQMATVPRLMPTLVILPTHDERCYGQKARKMLALRPLKSASRTSEPLTS